MSRLSLQVFGMPEVRSGEQILSFRTRKALALFIYLALESRQHSRDDLVSLLWPESDEVQGRASLRNALFQMRSLLQGVASHDGSAWITSEQGFLKFHRSSDLELDIEFIQRAFSLTNARLSTNQQDRQARLTFLQAAVDAYRADFLAGFNVQDALPFEQWAGVQREAWHRRMSQIFDRLSQLHIDGGELSYALDTTNRWLTHDALNEAVYQRLMQVHLITGDRTAALQVYEACRQMLSRELHSQPGPETLALVERIKMRRTSSNNSSSHAFPQSPVPMLQQGPLIGREHEYESLITHYHTTGRGEVQVVSIEGEAGIGKTRLAHDFVNWATAQGADVLLGRAFETGGHMPYQIMIEALRRRVEQENAPTDLLSDLWLAELSRLLPELRERYPDLPAPLQDDAIAQNTLFEAVARLIRAFAKRAPVVFWLDDIQWVDATTLDLLYYIGRHCKENRTRFLLLVNLRSESLHTLPRLTQWLINLERDLPVKRLQLDPLSYEEMLQLLTALGMEELDSKNRQVSRSLVQPDTPDSFSSWLFSQTKGQPFYLMETLKALLERNILTTEQRPGGIRVLVEPAQLREVIQQELLPPSIRAVISTRLAPLTTDSFTLLTAGAVLGQHFTFEQICQVADLAVNEGLLALDEVLQRDFLHEPVTDSMGTYSFTHDKLREVVYTEAGEARRRIFHRRAGDMLQREGASASELIQHAQGSGQVEYAFQLTIAAGDEALKVFASRDAITFYKQAQHLLTTRVDAGYLQKRGAESIRQHLLLQLGRAYEFANEWKLAHKTYESLLEFARTVHAFEVECTTLNRLAVLTARHSAEPGLALSLLQQARRIAEANRDTAGLEETDQTAELLAIRALDWKGTSSWKQYPPPSSTEQRATELMTHITNEYDLFNIHQGQWDEQRELVYELHRRYAVFGNQAMEVFCLSLFAGASIHRGQVQAALKDARTAYTMSFEIDNLWEQTHSAIFLSQALLDAGKYEEALHVAEKSVRDAKTLNAPPILYLHMMGSVYITLHLFEQARAVYQEMSKLNQPPVPVYSEQIAAKLCFISALNEHWEEAQHYALKALEQRDYSRVGVLFNTETLRCFEIEVLLRAGEVERAEEDVRRFSEQIGSSRRYRISYLRALAVLTEWHGSIDETIEHLRSASLLATELHLPGEAWQIQATLGKLYHNHEEHGRARQSYARAMEIVKELAEQIQDTTLKAKFMAAPTIQRLIEENQRYSHTQAK